MQLDRLPLPDPGEGQIRVRVEAAGVNFVDIYQRSGSYKTPIPLPHAMGVEGAGTVEAIGPGVDEVSPGDRVAWTGVPGSYATHALLLAQRAISVPLGVSCRDAAASMLQGMTAHYLTHSTYSLRPGDACLVHAAAGGVGLLICQFAKMLGATVFGTVSTEEKAAVAREYGADEVIVYSRQDFEAEVRRLTCGNGVNVVYDAVGKSTFEKSLNCLKPRGYMVLYGEASGEVPPLDTQILNLKGALYLTRPSLAYYTATRDELASRASEVFRCIQEGALRLRIDSVYPLSGAAEAHRHLASRRSSGKILLIPPGVSD